MVTAQTTGAGSPSSAALYGKPLVKPSTIEVELDRIRTAAAVQDAAQEAEKGGVPAARVRATLKNVILLNMRGRSPAVDTEIDRLIDQLCVAHPSRFFVVDSTVEPGLGELATAVSSRCFLADSGAHVCSEEVYISCGKSSAMLVPNLLISLLVPDVDTVLVVFGGAPTSVEETKFFGSLARLCDLVVYDSASLTGYLAGSRIILASLNEEGAVDLDRLVEPGWRTVSDVTWRRLRRWRGLIAEGFDAERFMGASGLISRMVLASAGKDVDSYVRSAETWLLAGWLVSSLDLTAERCERQKDSLRFHCVSGGDGTSPSRRSVLELRTEQNSGAPAPIGETAGASCLAAVEIEVDAAEYRGRMRVDRRFEKGTAEIAMGIVESDSTGENCCDFTVRSLPFPNAVFAEEVLSALVARRAESIFYPALRQSLILAELSGIPTS